MAVDEATLRIYRRLTETERKATLLLLAGLRNREIGEQLGTTEQVIKNVFGGVYDKVGKDDRTSLAIFIVRRPWLEQMLRDGWR
jgi:DNA-binding NarL/FixJ family response regulator